MTRKGILISVLLLLSVHLTFADCPQGDVNGDCTVNLYDIAIVAAEWLDEGTDIPMYPQEAFMQGERAMHLTLCGANQGNMRGNAIVQGREDTILVIGYSHRVEIPADVHTGLPSGQRLHHPLKITKYTDAASPLLLQALCTGEQITSFALDCYWTNAQDNVEHYYTIELEDAIILDYTVEHPNIETFSFTYAKITWTNHAANTEAVDDWKEPNP